MTNTLTWELKPFQLTKLNTNLLSALSLFVVCLMAFAMVHPALASHCGPEESALTTAKAAWVLASATLAAALLTANPIAIGFAIAAHGIATRAVNDAQAALDKCEDEHNSASGGCNSGGCG